MGFFDKEEDKLEREIGEIGNFYGSLYIKKDGGKYYWSIAMQDIFNWEEIPESLYDELNEFEDSRKG
ncbi:hypothetical protein JCM19235_1974 [Vibrio maritimus]|uniref:Uncharacterized protein n=1 Tax=Vibrio maritimus TaxID=990268 RepID=A0A090RTF8_9VIBR|nr:hypothetical protein JCM19235_1974 [Vibrio maritimus]